MRRIVFVGLLAISIPAWFPKPAKADEQSGEKDLEMGRRSNLPPSLPARR